MGVLLSLLPESFLWLGCLSAVLIVGIPHGALDIYLLWFNEKKSLSVFAKAITQYILMVLLGLFLWRIAPELFWASFFFAAIYHFGSSDEHPEVLAVIAGNSLFRLLWILSRGTMLVFAPLAFHPAKIVSYLSLAAPVGFAAQITAVSPYLLAYAGCFYLWTTYQCWKKSPLMAYRWILLKHLFSLFVLIALFFVSDPLLSFSLYFCCHHSLTHSMRVLNRIRNRVSDPLWVFLGLGTTLGVIPIVIWVSEKIAAGTVSQGIVTASFVTIAALTFPHLLVVQKLHQVLHRRLRHRLQRI